MWDGAADATVSFTHKTDLAHEEIAVPVDAPAWLRAMIEGRTIAQASEALRNTVVDRERHPQAQFARELEMSLPKELDREQQIALVRAFAREQP